MIVITGFAHPGIANIIRRAKDLTNASIYLALGGFHLSRADDPTVRDIIDSLQEMGVEKERGTPSYGMESLLIFLRKYHFAYYQRYK